MSAAKRKASAGAESRSNGKQRVDDQDDLIDVQALDEDGALDDYLDGDGLLADEEDGEMDPGVQGDDLQTGPEAEAASGSHAEAELPLSAQHLQSEEELDFSSLTISAAQARRMAPLICSNHGLTLIKFDGHALSVSELKEEEELEWDSEDYTDVEAIIIAEFLKTNTSIKRLDLARNLIADDGASALAQALSENTSLEYLNLESNSVAEKGGTALSQAFKSNKNNTLQYLNLAFNAIPSAVQQAIRDLWTEARQGQLGLHL